MRTSHLYFLSALLVLISLVHARGGGGGGGGGSGGGGGGRGGSGSGGSKTGSKTGGGYYRGIDGSDLADDDESDYPSLRSPGYEADGSGYYCKNDPSWLYPWVGSYYNGTITVSITLNDNQCTKGTTHNTTFSGVLGLGQLNWRPKPAKNPFQFMLSGWDSGTTAAPCKFNNNPVWAGFNTRLIFNSTSLDTANFNPTWEYNASLTTDKTGFGFNGKKLPLGTNTGSDYSAVNMTVPMTGACAAGPGTILFYLPPQSDGSTINGTFNAKNASLTVAGDFEAVSNWVGPLEPLRDTAAVPGGTLTGTYTVKFEGTVDDRQSDKFVAAFSDSGKNVWESETKEGSEDNFAYTPTYTDQTGTSTPTIGAAGFEKTWKWAVFGGAVVTVVFAML